MPLSPRDRSFLHAIERMKLLLVVLAASVFIYLMIVPPNDMQMVTSVIGVALCGVFWLTQCLLSFITQLDHELTRVINTLRRTLPEDQQRQLFN